MDIVQATFLLAIATFFLAVVAAVSAFFTARMASKTAQMVSETKKTRELYQEMVEEDRKKRETVKLIGDNGKILSQFPPRQSLVSLLVSFSGSFNDFWGERGGWGFFVPACLNKPVADWLLIVAGLGPSDLILLSIPQAA